MKKKPLACQLGMAGINFKHDRIDLCYRSIRGTRAQHTSVSEAVNDPILCNQRLELLNGNFPIGCYDCEFMEKQGVKSYRQRIKIGNKTDQRPDQWYIDNVDPTTGKIKHLKRLELRFNNVCNYACRHCSAEYSSTWETIIKQNPDIANFDYQNTKEIRTTSYSAYLEKLDLEKFIEDGPLEIEITGGEPFFQVPFYEFLEKVQPFASKINLMVTTNGSIAGKFKQYDVIGLLKNFQSINLKVSLDASESFYSYFRQGGDWNTVLKNVMFFKQLPQLILSPICTISVFQSARMPEIYRDYLKITTADNFSAGEVLHPPVLNPWGLPDPLKIKYLEEWETFRESLPENEKPWADTFATFSVQMLKSQTKDQNRLWKDFCSYTDKLDKIHNKRVFDYFPEWEQYWK
jgi:organic radical activating enzyme